VAFFVCSRFRVPVLPVLCIFAASAIVWLVETLRRQRFVAASAAVLAVLLLGLCVGAVPRQIDRTDANGLWLLGVHEVRHGNLEAGADDFRRAIAAKPRHPYAHRDLAYVLKDTGRTAEAEASFREAIAIRPDDPTTWRGLVDLQLRQGRFAEAKDSARRAVAIAPRLPGAQIDLGWVSATEARTLAHRGAPAREVEARRLEALEAFRAALALHPVPEQTFDCSFAAGQVLTDLGRWHEAVEVLSSALKARATPDPQGEYWSCLELYLDALVREGRAAEARAQAEAIEQRFPSEPRAFEIARKFIGH
jgi:tetratricopeptide (TPR) repeat protein